jgi:hypothetical protein
MMMAEMWKSQSEEASDRAFQQVLCSPWVDAGCSLKGIKLPGVQQVGKESEVIA